MTGVSLFVAAAALVPLVPAAVGAQQSDVSVSPFVSFLPTTGASPLAGLALTLAGNGGLALRASGHLALKNDNTNSFNTADAMRPWGGDADAVLFLGGHYLGGYEHTLSPYVFTGVGIAGRDSLGATVTRSDWSYGAGLNVPLGSAVDIFGESRWRMSRFVLPTAQLAPSPTTEIRVGLSFHIGGGGSSGRGMPRSRSASTGRRYPSRSTADVLYPASTTTSASAARLINAAEQYIGTPYVYGGTSPRGFDCSGFTQYVFARQGVRLPRTAAEQAQVGEALPNEWRAIAAGDLVMFAEHDRIDHVAIYAGHNRIIHSSSSGGGVRYDDLTTQRGQWFVDHMVAARRVTSDSRGLLLDLARGFGEVGVQLDGPDHAPRGR
ncbi:MAG TPA: C40 family peptidase [Gemmatimonadaceae bacterium]|nr:C40 family peptidase [Gemmatimonadaceae bacterium]